MGLDYFSSRRDEVSEALWQGPDLLLHTIKGEMQVFAHYLNNSVSWKLPGHSNILSKSIYGYESPKGNLMHNHIFIWLQLCKRPINICADRSGNWPFQEVLEVFVPKIPSLISCLIANKSTFKVDSCTWQMSHLFLPEIDRSQKDHARLTPD